MAVRVAYLSSVAPDGTDRRAAVGQMAVAALDLERPAPLRDARMEVAAGCEQAATAADVDHQASLASSDAAGSTVHEAVVPHRRAAASMMVDRLRALRVWPPPQAAPVAARYAAASPEAVLQARADAPVAASCPVLRCEAGSSAGQIARMVAVVVPRALLRRPVREVLRWSPRQPVVLRLGRARERSRLGVLPRRQREVAVRLRSREAARRLRPGPRPVPAR